MPSNALLRWQTDRVPRLSAVEAQCAATLAVVPPTTLADENLRGFVVLLSAHFQGFCRDLYSESSQVIAAAVPPTVQPIAQRQFAAALRLAHNNPTLDTLKADFGRFGFDLPTELNAVAVPPIELNHLALLSRWRNDVAHHGVTAPPGGPLSPAMVRSWQQSCDALATALDGIMYNQLRAALGAPPW